MRRVHFGPGDPTAVKHLHDGEGTLLPDRLHDGLPGLDLLRGEQTGLPRVPLCTLVVRHDGFRVDESGSVFCPPHEEVEDILAWDAAPRG